jgi:hypothetical protein
MFKKVLISSAVAIALSTSIYAGGDFKKLEEKEVAVAKQIKIENNNSSNVIVRELKNGQPVDTVYSEVKVEYADVKTIERLKRAVVILIEKVENFEKKVDAKEVSKNDLHVMQKDLKSDLAYKFGKKLDKLSKNTARNTSAIKLLKKEGRSIVKKSIPKSSKYDKKIEEFLNKENSSK